MTDTQQIKVCTGCGEAKTLEHFGTSWNNIRQKRYPMSRCRLCIAEQKRDPATLARAAELRREKYATPDGKRKKQSQYHKWKYGITLDERDAMLAQQGGGCAICGVKEPPGKGWCTDHDRACCPDDKSCGKCIRGILCCNCNCGIGQLADDPFRLHFAIQYLERTRIPPI